MLSIVALLTVALLPPAVLVQCILGAMKYWDVMHRAVLLGLGGVTLTAAYRSFEVSQRKRAAREALEAASNKSTTATTVTTTPVAASPSSSAAQS